MVHAYAWDVHFYESYLMARHAGIRHEVALHLATFAQYTDENFKTGPVGLSYSRRLFHFPGDVVKFDPSSDKASVLKYKFGGSQVVRNTTAANDVIATGLKKGDKYLVGSGLHVLQDSFGHEGYYSIPGHVSSGHWPDRPWWRPDTHEEMNETLFKAFVAIRKSLPDSAIDREFKTDGINPNYKLSASELFQRYKKDSLVQSAIHNNPFYSTEYKTESLKMILENAQAKGVILPRFQPEAFLGDPVLTDSSKDVRQALDEIIDKYLRQGKLEAFVDPQKLSEMFNISVKRLSVEEKRGSFSRDLTNILCQGIIPRELNAKDNANTIESENALRNLEMRQRTTKWREVIKSETGKDIYWPRHGKITEPLPADCIVAKISSEDMRGWKKSINNYKWWSPLSEKGKYFLKSESSGRVPASETRSGLRFHSRADGSNLDYQIEEELENSTIGKKIMTDKEVSNLITHGTTRVGTTRCLKMTLLKMLGIGG